MALLKFIGLFTFSHGGTRINKGQCGVRLASFPGSPLTPTKNINGGGEPGTDSHVAHRRLVLWVYLGSNTLEFSTKDR